MKLKSDIELSSEAINRLYAYQKQNTFLIRDINSWLTENLEYFHSLNKKKKVDFLPQEISLSSKADQFLSTYQELNVISNFNKKESFFKNELEQIQAADNYDFEKYRDYITNEYSSFVIDYLDYSEAVTHLNIFTPTNPSIEINIAIDDFHYTLKYLKYYFNV